MSPFSTSASALSPEYVLLGLLQQKPTHGYDLHQRLVSELGQMWHVSLSQTYNILHRLEERGVIRAINEHEAQPRSRRQLRLTAAGQRSLNTWLNAPTSISARAIRVEFITRLYFAYAKDSALARTLIETQIAEVEAGIARLHEKSAEIPTGQTFNQLGLELRIRQLKSILGWLEECSTTLDLNP